MARIEDYALIGDTQTAALVGKDGSIDWLCLPRFDSAACFAALLGTRDHGRWLVAPVGGARSVQRRYLDGTLILETTFTTDTGTVRVIDFMPVRDQAADLVRIVEGVDGRVEMETELVIRFDYGSRVPWVRTEDGVLHAVAGPDALAVASPVPLHGENLHTVGHFAVTAGDRLPFVLEWRPSHLPFRPHYDPEDGLRRTQEWWSRWSAHSTYRGPYADAVERSLITLKALTYEPTGGIVAAPTTSLPEHIGGVRNWDYRYCWLRDATFTLLAFMDAGYREEAEAFRQWLLRATSGLPSQMRIMYGVAGETRLPELELGWLPGYEGSSPVRIGNGAASQFQLDVYGEVMDVLAQGREHGLQRDENAWGFQRALMKELEKVWRQPDEGIWEIRGPRRHFTHSKVMAWVAADRAVSAVERHDRAGPVERWRALRDEIHAEVCAKAWDADRQAFTMYYGSRGLDASVLTMPLVGFLPPDDPRVASTVAAIERELVTDGFVRRYDTSEAVDGLPSGEGTFLICTFWLADNYLLLGRRDEARELFERLLSLRNDVGLLAEEWDPVAGRQLGNFPQAFSHESLINTAIALERDGSDPLRERREHVSDGE